MSCARGPVAGYHCHNIEDPCTHAPLASAAVVDNETRVKGA